jgi:hypothetical protein
MFNPKKGEEVYVCYDGKWGRKVTGTVVCRRGFAIKVKFNEWAEPTNEIISWFVRTSDTSFGAFVKVNESLMKMMFGTKGDWYSVYDKEDTNER